MQSIKQNPSTQSPPNFRNLGIILRVLVLVNGMTLMAAWARAPSLSGVVREFAALASAVEPVLFMGLVALYCLHGLLVKISYRWAVVVVLAVTLGVTTLTHYASGYAFGREGVVPIEQYWISSAVAALIVLAYLNLRSRALSPALSEARLQALQARIRPHFLFNSINAVLSVIRTDPRRAEALLEDMADLFRVLMADNRKLSTLAQEVELCRRYLELEQLRLGDRLRVEWHIDKMPGDALVPPLVLQPLVENAVYHGIEPVTEPGTIAINIYKSRGEVHAVLRNPYLPDGNHHTGNKMAIANIKERLSLHFDAEARLDAQLSGGTYQVHITLPYQSAGSP